MKAFAAAIIALILITAAANYGLMQAPWSIEDKTSSDAVRLG